MTFGLDIMKQTAGYGIVLVAISFIVPRGPEKLTILRINNYHRRRSSVNFGGETILSENYP